MYRRLFIFIDKCSKCSSVRKQSLPDLILMFSPLLSELSCFHCSHEREWLTVCRSQVICSVSGWPAHLRPCRKNTHFHTSSYSAQVDLPWISDRRQGFGWLKRFANVKKGEGNVLHCKTQNPRLHNSLTLFTCWSDHLSPTVEWFQWVWINEGSLIILETDSRERVNITHWLQRCNIDSVYPRPCSVSREIERVAKHLLTQKNMHVIIALSWNSSSKGHASRLEKVKHARSWVNRCRKHRVRSITRDGPSHVR